MGLELTIAICAYNAERRLPLTLEALARQEIPSGVTWEVLVVDNASTDGTGRVAAELGGRLGLPLRVIEERTPGLTAARRRAAEEARGEYLSYIDDDNIVEGNWVGACVKFMKENPGAGVIGGRVDAMFEEPEKRPADFEEKYANALAIRDMGGSAKRLRPPESDPPCGAGMTGRTEVFRKVLTGIGCVLSDRKGASLTSGGDTEIGLLAHRLGWELWYTPTLRMCHLLPSSRLTQGYLDKLVAGGAQSAAWLDYLRGKEPKQTRMQYALQWLNMKRIAWMFWLQGLVKSGRFKFWTELYDGRARGYWLLARRYPFSQLDEAICRHRKH